MGETFTPFYSLVLVTPHNPMLVSFMLVGYMSTSGFHLLLLVGKNFGMCVQGVSIILLNEIHVPRKKWDKMLKDEACSNNIFIVCFWKFSFEQVHQLVDLSQLFTSLHLMFATAKLPSSTSIKWKLMSCGWLGKML